MEIVQRFRNEIELKNDDGYLMGHSTLWVYVKCVSYKFRFSPFVTMFAFTLSFCNYVT